LSIIRRQERERFVLELYNQGKTIREIAKEARMSFRDIGVILNKAVEEKTEALKEEQRQDSNNDVKNNQQEPHLSLAAKAYKLFSEGKTPVEVAVTLYLGQPEVTKLYREYWKLKRLYRLYSVYKELGDEGIEDFLKLHKLSKKEGYSREQVVTLLQLADEDNTFGLLQLGKRRKWCMDEIHEFDMQIERSKEHLNNVNDEIASASSY
jgi:DNA-binding CsgD family transcriptional regulator